VGRGKKREQRGEDKCEHIVCTLYAPVGKGGQHGAVGRGREELDNVSLDSRQVAQGQVASTQGRADGALNAKIAGKGAEGNVGKGLGVALRGQRWARWSMETQGAQIRGTVACKGETTSAMHQGESAYVQRCGGLYQGETGQAYEQGLLFGRALFKLLPHLS
jgi:hypothetical protein